MSFLEKYLLDLNLQEKRYSLSILDNKDSFVLGVSDNKYKQFAEIKENIKLTISGEYVETAEHEGIEVNNLVFDKKNIEIQSSDCYCKIVDYMKECLRALNIKYKETSFDFSMENEHNTFNYVISDTENLFIRAEVDGRKIY